MFGGWGIKGRRGLHTRSWFSLLCNKARLLGLCSVVDLSCIYLLFLAGAIYYTIIIIYICGREAAAIFFGIFGNKIVNIDVWWAKKTVPSCGRKKRCLHVGEKNGAFKILKTGFSEVCVNMLWDSLNFNGTRVYLLQNKRTTTEKLKQLVEMLLQSKQKNRLSNNLKKLFFGASSNSL